MKALSASLAALALFAFGSSGVPPASGAAPPSGAASTSASSSPASGPSPAASAAAARVKDLMTRDLIGAAGKEVTMLTVEYPPGGKSAPHRHHAQVFVYVLEGHVRMQVEGAPLVTLGPGETFYESPQDLHVVSQNASDSEPARFLVLMVRDKAKPGAGRS